jgi:aryl-alcohol dehydrogenase-like predicted oxidoreductase
LSAPQRTELAPDYNVSRLLKGGWQLAGGHGPVDQDAALEDMRRFVEAGVTTFDCADIYTGVEELIGEFRARFSPGKSLPEMQVHTKYVPDLAALPRLRKVDVERAIDRSRARLRMERLDLVQFHWWDYDVPGYLDAGQWLTELQRAGKIRHIGVTNFDVPRLAELLAAGVPVVSHQVQYSVVDARPENGMVPFCQEHGILLLGYGTALGGLLSERFLFARPPEPPHENRSLAKYALIVEEFGGWELFQELLHALARVGQKHGVSLTTVGARYVLDRPAVAGVIVGARDASHLAENLRVFDIRLDEEDLRLIEAVIDRREGPTGDTYALERRKGGRHGAIMKYDLGRH